MFRRGPQGPPCCKGWSSSPHNGAILIWHRHHDATATAVVRSRPLTHGTAAHLCDTASCHQLLPDKAASHCSHSVTSRALQIIPCFVCTLSKAGQESTRISSKGLRVCSSRCDRRDYQYYHARIGPRACHEFARHNRSAPCGLEGLRAPRCSGIPKMRALGLVNTGTICLLGGYRPCTHWHPELL